METTMKNVKTGALLAALALVHTSSPTYALSAAQDPPPTANKVVQSETTEKPTLLTFYINGTQLLKKASTGEHAIEKSFQEIVTHLGKESRWARVGISLNYPYTNFLEGTGPNDFHIPDKFKVIYGRILKVAKQMNLPVLVAFNGSVWVGGDGPFHRYWKTKDGGKYLMRYKDGQVNEGIKIKTNTIPRATLSEYLGFSGYVNSSQALLLTNSKHATDYHESRIAVLRVAVKMFKELDGQYPDVIQAFSTDSEVSTFSFRKDENGRFIGLGYEDFVTVPFCEKHGIANREEYFKNRTFTYDNAEDLKWFEFRSDLHRDFVASTAHTIRSEFKRRRVFTHQLLQPDSDKVMPGLGYDFASPQSTAIVPDTNPGVTVYVYGGRDKRVKVAIDEFAEKAGDKVWGAMEFHPGKQWSVSSDKKAEYTYEFVRYLYKRNVRLICPFSWESNSLDSAVKGSGVDEGIRRFIAEGPDRR